jgi:hypothetical protein
MNRKRVILAVLLGVLALCILYAYFATPRLEKAPPRVASKQDRSVPRVTGDTRSAAKQTRIDFDFLTVEPQKFSGAKRDIFSYVRKRPVAPPVVEEVVETVPEVPVEEPQVPVVVVNHALSKFTFLGFLEKVGEKTVFLSSGGNLFLVKRGERFGADQEFLVADITGNLLQVRHTGRDELIEVPLIEQQKLSASASAPARIEPAAPLPSQQRAKSFTPKRRMLRPEAPRGSEEAFPEMIEENDPEEGQEFESPGEGDGLEGEVNGSNQ